MATLTSQTVIQMVGVNLNPEQLQELETSLNDYTPSADLFPSTNNQRIITQVGIGVGITTGVSIIISLLLAFINGNSIVELLYTNLITILFIILTDIVILSIFGSFDLLQTTFLVGIAANFKNQQINQVGIADTEDCRKIMETTLDSMFPGFENLISNFF